MSRYARVLARLGWQNVFSVLCYRLAVRTKILKVVLPKRHAVAQPIIPSPEDCRLQQDKPPALQSEAVCQEAEKIADGEIRYFSHEFKFVGCPPDWFLNPFTGKRVEDRLHWSEIADFDRATGDIKCVWEASRFDWALCLARAYRATRNKKYIELLASWADDWKNRNPPNRGPNWKCGQESSIRILNILLSLELVGASDGGSGLPDFVAQHCTRISRTLRYAVAQDNNHGTSEAAALFVAGTWLSKHPQVSKRMLRKGRYWCRRGRRWLENRAGVLIENDGSFSQYSTNYHRLVLDTLSLAEWWRRRYRAAPFSDGLYSRAGAAVDFLYHLVDPISGDVPNIGGNDGATLLRLSDSDYRDFRPSLQHGTP
jgi:hypothetical protein